MQAPAEGKHYSQKRPPIFLEDVEETFGNLLAKNAALFVSTICRSRPCRYLSELRLPH
jgi:hypothetical protein